MLNRIAAALAAVLLTCAPATAQLDTRTIPQAQPLTGSERMPAVQGSGCTAKTTPCASVAVTPSLILAFLAPTFQPLDSDLTAIASLSTADFGRQLLTKADAPSTRTALGLGSLSTQPASGVAITGGAINGTPIGAATPTTGAFTTATTTGNAAVGSAIVSTVRLRADQSTTGSYSAWLHNSSNASGSMGAVVSTADATYASVPLEVRSNTTSATGGTRQFSVRGNGVVTMPSLPTYATDSAAGTGGLVAGDVYKTSTGELRIKL
ncbi:hypothetical protein [Sphingomonas sp. Mn802worker]|uniref:hypothetical protein n=1 Tax=Sphingomonas sp. Mn802worker TaxID=629773 RepID=UPI00037E5155|nr:hypothetical protein [Sphingomonas sp. Mn802worker]